MNLSNTVIQMIKDYESINNTNLTEREKDILEQAFVFGIYTAINHNKFIIFPEWAKEDIESILKYGKL